jgi:hypothetical protein
MPSTKDPHPKWIVRRGAHSEASGPIGQPFSYDSLTGAYPGVPMSAQLWEPPPKRYSADQSRGTALRPGIVLPWRQRGCGEPLWSGCLVQQSAHGFSCRGLCWLLNSSTRVSCAEVAEFRYHEVQSTMHLKLITAR